MLFRIFVKDTMSEILPFLFDLTTISINIIENANKVIILRTQLPVEFMSVSKVLKDFVCSYVFVKGLDLRLNDRTKLWLNEAEQGLDWR